MYLDSTFGGIGFAAYYYNVHYDGAYDLAIQNNGKIVVVGDATYFTSTLTWKVERLNIDGTNDTTFHAEPNFLMLLIALHGLFKFNLTSELFKWNLE